MLEDSGSDVEVFIQLIEDRLNAVLAEHPARERITELVVEGAPIMVRRVGDGVYEAEVEASAEEWYALILDTRP